jgi:hypothetical protein
LVYVDENVRAELDYYPNIVIYCQEPATFMRVNFPIRRHLKTVFALTGVLALTGCWKGRILFSFEQPFWSSIGGGSSLQMHLAGVAAVRGYLPRLIIGGEGSSSLEALESNLSLRDYAAAFVGPLLSFQWSTFVSKYPGTRFVLIATPAPGEPFPPNAVYLGFDRTNSFHDAGHISGEAIRGKFGAADVSALGQRIAVLLSDESDLAAEEVESFNRGVAEATDGGHPVLRNLKAPIGQTEINAAVQEMRRAGAEVFLLGLGQHNSLGLKALHDDGGIAVLADWELSSAFPSQVLLSIEEDVPDGIMRALDALNAGVSLVQGPVRLVRGKKI